MRKVIFVVMSLISVLIIYMGFNTTVEVDKYSQESVRSDELYRRSISVMQGRQCPPQQEIDRLINELKSLYPESVVAKKGENVLFDGFLFSCLPSENNDEVFQEVK